MIDSSSIRLHQHAANAKKHDGSGCMGRLRGGVIVPQASSLSFRNMINVEGDDERRIGDALRATSAFPSWYVSSRGDDVFASPSTSLLPLQRASVAGKNGWE